MTYICRNERPI